MQVTHDHWNPDLLGDQYIAHTPKGRRSGSAISKQTGRHLALAVAILLIGLASAATAFTVHRHSAAQEANFIVGANSFGGPGRVGLADVLY
jgi:hypothetical protein